MLVGKRPSPDYVYLLKKLMKENKHEEIHLSGKGDHGNSKVIWIANRMVLWGYCAIVKIRTQVPSTLEISLKKTADFDQHCDAFDKVKAEKRAQRDAEKAKTQATPAAAEADNPAVEKAAEEHVAPVAEPEASKAE